MDTGAPARLASPDRDVAGRYATQECARALSGARRAASRVGVSDRAGPGVRSFFAIPKGRRHHERSNGAGRSCRRDWRHAAKHGGARGSGAGLGWAAAAGNAYASGTSLALYGVADAGPGHLHYQYRRGETRASFVEHDGLRSGGAGASRLGLQGEEDLGGGVRAIFNLEASVDLADGASKSSFWNRYAYVGLSSERLGTLTLGRQKDLPSQFAKGEPVKSLGK